MRKKTLALFSLMLAFVMALSLAVLAGCKKGNKTEKPKGDGTAVSLVSDETLKDKLLALYTFEDTDKTLKASDPFTGEAREANNGTYGDNYKLAVNPKANGGSTTVFDTSTAFSLGRFDETQITDEFEDYFIVEGNTYEGLSFSFWAYNTVTLEGEVDSLGESADWANLVTNGYESINWGNLSYMATSDGEYKAFYPTNGTVIGRGAYTEDSYAQARELYTDSELAKFRGKSDYFAVWNAISGNTQGEGSDDNEYVAPVAAAYLQTWRYVTINIDLEEGLSFYNNGRLAYTYQPKTFITLEGGWEQIYADLVMGAMKEYEADEMYLNFFNAESGIYVDDLIVGKSLTAADACNLYEDVSGKTWTDADLELTSALSQGDQEEQEEKNRAVKAYLENMTSEETITAARDEFIANYDASAYLEAIGKTDCSTSVDGKTYYIPTAGEGGSYSMTVSGIQLSAAVAGATGADAQHFLGAALNLAQGANNTYVASVSIANTGWKWSNNNTPAGVVTWDYATFNNAQRYSYLDVTLSYNGTDTVTIKYDIYYYFYDLVGTTIKLQKIDADGNKGDEFDYVVTKDDAYYGSLTYTVTSANTTADLSQLRLYFYADKACFNVTAVKGGTLYDPSKPALVEGNNPLYTYSNTWYSTGSDYAQTVLPSGDFDITYTADVYTAAINSWHGPSFIMMGGNLGDNTPGDGGNPLVYVRCDNYDGNNKNITADHGYSLSYTKQAGMGAFRYTLGEQLYKNGDVYLCAVTPLKLICNITRTGNNYSVTYYKDSVSNENIIQAFTFTFTYAEQLILSIGGEGTYMENIVITNNIVGGSDLTLTKTTSGTKTAVNTDGYTPVTAA